MIVFAWFILMAIIALVGFTMVGLTFVHWFKQSRLAPKSDQQSNLKS